MIPLRFGQTVLEIGEGDTRHRRVSVEAGPGSTFELTQPEFLLELLVRLLAHPTGRDGRGQVPQRGPWRQVAEVVFALTAPAPFADEPNLIAGLVAMAGLRGPSATRIRSAAKCAAGAIGHGLGATR
jgi:hypothetical protein